LFHLITIWDLKIMLQEIQIMINKKKKLAMIAANGLLNIV